MEYFKEQFIVVLTYFELLKRFPDLDRKDRADLLRVIAEKVAKRQRMRGMRINENY